MTRKGRQKIKEKFMPFGGGVRLLRLAPAPPTDRHHHLHLCRHSHDEREHSDLRQGGSSGSGLLPKFGEDFLVQRYVCDKIFYEDAISFSRGMSQISDKRPISQC